MIEKALFTSHSPPVVVATHMRSGTHLTMDLLRRQFADVGSWKWPGEAIDSAYLALDVLGKLEADWGEARAIRILNRTKRPLFKVHWTEPDLESIYQNQPELAGWLDEQGCFIYVIRHPVKVMASMWAWEVSQDSCDLKSGKVPKDWLESKMRYWKYHQEAWGKRSGCHFLRFEDIISDTGKTLNQISSWLGERPLMRSPLLPPKLKSIHHSRWNRLTEFRPASTEILTSVKADSVEEFFSDTEFEVMETIAGDAIEKWGYKLKGS